MEDPLTGLDDASLIRKAQQNDAQAFEELFKRYEQKVLGFIRDALPDAPDIEDIKQRVFFKAWQQRGSFRGEGKRGKPAKFSSWLIGITEHECSKWKRSLARQKKRIVGSTDETTTTEEGEELKYDAPDPSPSPVEQASFHELQQKLQEAISQLAEPIRWVVSLKMLGKSDEDIGKELDIPPETAKSRYYAGMRQLEKQKHLRELLDEMPR